MKDDTIVHIITDQVSFFFQLLSQGIIGSTIEGSSINDYLVKELGVDQEYIAHRIQTIFLDGRTVDDVETTFLKQGSTLALSAAMPGLVGATFRRSGFYSNLRKQISHEQQSTSSSDQRITFKLKLFNIVAKELGPELFANGILINGKVLKSFIVHQEDRLLSICKKQTIDKKNTNTKDFFSLDWEDKTAYLIITKG
jgi:hypothetical protein